MGDSSATPASAIPDSASGYPHSACGSIRRPWVMLRCLPAWRASPLSATDAMRSKSSSICKGLSSASVDRDRAGRTMERTNLPDLNRHPRTRACQHRTALYQAMRCPHHEQRNNSIWAAWAGEPSRAATGCLLSTHSHRCRGATARLQAAWPVETGAVVTEGDRSHTWGEGEVGCTHWRTVDPPLDSHQHRSRGPGAATFGTLGNPTRVASVWLSEPRA
jgi:hypothetical protein